MNHDISALPEGLLKIAFPHFDTSYDELVLKLGGLGLPNDIFCFRPTLRDYMKAKDMMPTRAYFGLISGYPVKDEHVVAVTGRSIALNEGYHLPANFDLLMITCNSPVFGRARDSVIASLDEAGLNVKTSSWDDYKAWEQQKIREM